MTLTTARPAWQDKLAANSANLTAAGRPPVERAVAPPPEAAVVQAYEMAVPVQLVRRLIAVEKELADLRAHIDQLFSKISR